MRSTSTRLVAVLALVYALGPTMVYGQAPCRFVLGFAELAAQLGPAIVGTCLEDQRTATGPELWEYPGQLPLAIPTGAAVQRTTTGLFCWHPDGSLSFFFDGPNRYAREPWGVRKETWEELRARNTPAAPPTATPVPPAVQAQQRAQAVCFDIASATLIGSLYATPAEQARAESESRAISYLCGQAVDQYGERGFTCFSRAWDAAVGMQRVFAGSGRQVYDDKFAACIDGRQLLSYAANVSRSSPWPR